MNMRALHQWERRCKRAFCMLAGMALAGFLGWQAYADDIWRVINQNQTLAFNSTSAMSTTAFGAQTYRTRFTCSVSCWISFSISGSNPSASSATGIFVPANLPQILVTNPSGFVAVISASGTPGVLSIVELTK